MESLTAITFCVQGSAIITMWLDTGDGPAQAKWRQLSYEMLIVSVRAYIHFQFPNSFPFTLLSSNDKIIFEELNDGKQAFISDSRPDMHQGRHGC